MKQQINSKYFVALGISVSLLACSKPAKQSESAVAADSTAQKTAVVEVPSTDADKVAPDHYKLVKDTMGIRVMEITYKPGDSSAMHTHPDYVLYVIEGGKGQMTTKEGKKQLSDYKKGMIMISGAGTHSVRNVGTTTMRAILVEVNRPNIAAPAGDAKLDATKAAPALYKTVASSRNIRVVMATYKPGATSAMHTHPDYALYVVQGGKAVMTLKDGKKVVNNLASGAIAISPGDAHSVRNTGKGTLKALIVEVNRPLK